MKTRYCILILFLHFLLLTTCSVDSFAQLTVVNEPQTPSVQAAEMTKYGKQDVNLYTGELSLNIPIYTYRDDDFTIPVSLSYSYNGLKVNQQAGYVGLGWTLNFGGYITRQVRGIPDEERSSMTISQDGYASVDLYGYNYNSYYPVSQFEAQPLYGEFTPGKILNIFYHSSTSGKRYEVTSDIYHFNFLGHSGTFVKDRNTGKYNVYHTSSFDKDYTIVYDYNTESYEGNSYVVISGYDIKTSDGYTYHFGSCDPLVQPSISRKPYDATERDITIDKNKSDSPIPGTITAWALRRITAPNGRYVEFLYENDVKASDEPSSTINYNSSLWYYSDNEPNSIIHYTESYHSYLLPYAIVVDGTTKISFSYTEKQTGEIPWYRNGIKGPDSISGLYTYPLLTGINDTRGSCSLVYSFNSQGSPYPFLSKVDIDSLGCYSFIYRGLDYGYFPLLGTSAKDHWGYLNKTEPEACDLNYVAPSQLFQNNGLTETLTSFRNPNFDASSLGLMASVIYPTGGSSTFEWEANTYTSKVAKTASNGFVPALFQENGTGPGGRIRKIVNRTRDGIPIDSTSYNYTSLNVSGQSSGSGTLLISPRYSLSYGGYLYNRRGINTGVFKTVFFYSDGGIVAYDGIPVEYSEVEQVFTDGSSTRTRFTSWVNGFPDEFPTRQTLFFPRLYGAYADEVNLVPNSQDRQAVTNILSPCTSLQWRRGKILSQNLYDSSSRQLRRITNIYLPSSQRLDAYEYIYVGEAAVSIYKMTNAFHQTGSVVEDSLGNKSASFSSGSSYNSIGLKISDSSINIRGDTTVTEYLYLWDKNESQASLSPAEDSMMIAGWYSMPLEVKTVTIKNGQESLVSADRYTYRKVAGSDSLNFKPVAWEKKDVESGQWYTFATYKYDKFGRMIQKTDANGISTVFVWSSEHLGPSLRIDNATVSEVSSIISGCLYSTGNTNAQSRASTLKSQLPRSAVSWFSWYEYGMPEYVGDPSGRVTHYTYDSAKRLHLVVDDSHNPVEKYDYQTATRKE